MWDVGPEVKEIVEEFSYDITYTQVASATRTGVGGLNKTNTETVHQIKGHISGYKSKELAGNFIQQGDRKLRIAADSIAFTPKADDTVTHKGKKYRVVSVDTRGDDSYGEYLHIVQIRG